MEGNRDPPKRQLKLDPGPRHAKRRLKRQREEELASGEWDGIIAGLGEDDSSEYESQPSPAIAKTLTTYDTPTGLVKFYYAAQNNNHYYPTMTRRVIDFVNNKITFIKYSLMVVRNFFLC